MQLFENRLTIIGPKKALARFRVAELENLGQHFDILEQSAFRLGWQFESDGSVVERLTNISEKWPKLTFLWECENRRKRSKLLAKIARNQVETFQIRY